MRNGNFEFDEAFRGNSVSASPQQTENGSWTSSYLLLAVGLVGAGIIGGVAGAVFDGVFGTNTLEKILPAVLGGFIAGQWSLDSDAGAQGTMPRDHKRGCPTPRPHSIKP